MSLIFLEVVLSLIKTNSPPENFHVSFSLYNLKFQNTTYCYIKFIYIIHKNT